MVRAGGVAAVVMAHLRAKGGGRRAALNFALHANLALAAGMLLPLAPAALWWRAGPRAARSYTANSSSVL